MTAEQFVYWLQGYAEVTKAGGFRAPTEAEWKVIMDHLQALFTKVTPDRTPAQEELLKEIVRQTPWDPSTRIC